MNTTPQRLAGRRIIVTGASSGIGRAVAIAAVTAGADVAGVARRGDRLAALHDAHGVHPVVGDVADASAAGSIIAECVKALGGVDVLVNSAGIARPGLIADADPADWKAMFDVNVIGLLAVTQAAIPLLLASTDASIVNISSMSGRRIPAAAGGTYAATKFAVHAISETLRLELQPQGVRVTTVSPGFVATEIFDGMAKGPHTASYQHMVRDLGISPADVADAVVHTLAAPQSVTTVEIAMVPTAQGSGAYSAE